MKAEITVTRTPYNVEQFVTVEVTQDSDGCIFADPVEDVYERHLIFGAQGCKEEELPGLLAMKGKDFDLSDEEIEEAKKAISSNQAAYDASEKEYARSQWLGINAFPLAGLSPHEEQDEHPSLRNPKTS